MNKVQLTRAGHQKIEEERKELIDLKKPAAIDRLQKARSMGDLKENSEYSAAKEELAFVEGRVQEIELILKNVEIIEEAKHTNTVSLGKKVTIKAEKGDSQEFYIVGEFEADPMEKKLSQTSPIGKALVGRKIGESVEVEVPDGKISYKILQIS